MGVQQQNWFNTNASRKYPIDESASGITDHGDDLPNNILADCIIHFPNTYGKFAFLSAINVSPRLVTLCISAANSHPALTAVETPDADPDGSLLATLTLVKPITEGRHYQFTDAETGVAGWVVFASDLADITFNGTFSSSSQSVFTVRCGRSYTPPGVTSFGKFGVESVLRGDVTLASGPDIELVEDFVNIEGTMTRVMLARLKSISTENLFDKYRGPCGVRPESGTCLQEPIEVFGNLIPDCNGTVFMNIVGLVAIPSNDGHGIAFNFDLGMEQTCTDSILLPDADGVIPGTYDDMCVITSSILDDDPVEPDDDIIDDNFDSWGASAFYALNGDDSDFITVSGAFGFTPLMLISGIGTSPGDPYVPRSALYYSLSQARQNISIWNKGTIAQEYARTISVKLLFTEGVRRNGGLILGLKQTESPVRNTFYYVEASQNSDSLRIRYFNGATYSYPIGVVGPIGLVLDKWYILSATIYDLNEDGGVTLWVSINDTFDPGNVRPGVTLQVTLPRLLEIGSYIGFGTDRAITAFADFGVTGS